MLGFGELWPILAIVVVIFGAKQIPLLMRGLGQGIKEFKTAVHEDDEGKEELELPKNSAEDSK